MLGDSVAAVMRKHPRAIAQAMITMRKSTHGFPFVSHMSMGLRLAALLGRRSSTIIASYVIDYFDKTLFIHSIT